MTKAFIINNLEFAQNALKLVDSFEIAAFKRLQETLALTEQNRHLSAIHVELLGNNMRFRQPSLHLHIKTQLPIICQRCLDEMQIDLDLSFDYLISNTPSNEQDDSDEVDWLEANSEMDLQALIEDELLLAMPIAPIHETTCGNLSMHSGEKPNPFAILKGKIK